MKETCGLKQSESYGYYDQETASLKTFQVSLIPDTLEESLKTFTNHGMMLNGVLSELIILDLPTEERGCGFMPTPRAVGIEEHWETIKSRREKTGIGVMNVRAWLEQIGTIPKEAPPIHPEYYEWLMDWPIGNTDLKPLETDKFRQWWKRHGKS